MPVVSDRTHNGEHVSVGSRRYSAAPVKRNTEPPYGDTESPYGDTEPPYGDTEPPYGDTESPYGDTELPYGNTERHKKLPVVLSDEGRSRRRQDL